MFVVLTSSKRKCIVAFKKSCIEELERTKHNTDKENNEQLMYR